MNNRKGQNSFLILTTLGAYLGLVFVGATPQVMAQAAMTRQFDVKDEIEFKDDLDKKPDDEKSLQDYASAVQSLYRHSSRLILIDSDLLLENAYNLECSIRLQDNGTLTTSCRGKKGLLWGGSFYEIHRISSVFPPIAEGERQQLGVNLVISPTEFNLKSSLSPILDSHAQCLAEALNSKLSQLRLQMKSDPRVVLYESTLASHANNQVFIVTRLPRAGLDSLLATKDAK